MRKRPLVLVLIVIGLVMGLGFAATTYAPVYTPLPPSSTPSAADILGNYSFDQKFIEINTNLQDLKGGVVSLQAKVDSQTNAFNTLAQQEEQRFLQAEAIKRSDERIQSQLAGYRLFTLLSVAFSILFCIFMLRKTLDDFKNEMKQQIKGEVEADLHNQVRMAIIPPKETKPAKKKNGQEEDSRIAIPIKQAPSLKQTPEPEPSVQPPAAPPIKKQGFISRFFGRFKKKETPKSAEALMHIKAQLTQDNQNVPVRAYPDVVSENTPNERMAIIEKTVESTQKQIQALLEYTVAKHEQQRQKPQSQTRTKPKPKNKSVPQPAKKIPSPAKPPTKKILATVESEREAEEGVEVDLEKEE